MNALIDSNVLTALQAAMPVQVWPAERMRVLSSHYDRPQDINVTRDIEKYFEVAKGSDLAYDGSETLTIKNVTRTGAVVIKLAAGDPSSGMSFHIVSVHNGEVVVVHSYRGGHDCKAMKIIDGLPQSMEGLKMAIDRYYGRAVAA